MLEVLYDVPENLSTNLCTISRGDLLLLLLDSKFYHQECIERAERLGYEENSDYITKCKSYLGRIDELAKEHKISL